MEIQSLTTQSLIEAAGNARLPSIINIKGDVIDDQSILQTMEYSVYDYTQKVPNFAKELHNKKVRLTILNDIVNILDRFDFIIKPYYKRLWEIFILNITDEVEIKQVLSKIMEKIVNKKIKTFVESNIRSSGKITSIIKTLLNISQTFVSIFTPDTLSKAEQIAYDNTIRLNERYTSFLDTFIEMINYNESPDLNISRFFNSVRKITEPRIRNQYYNMFLFNLISNLTMKVGKILKPISNPVIQSIFVQVYLYLINYEIIKTVDSLILSYIKSSPINWFTYQVTQLTDKLYPNWNFNVKGFVLDDWQKNTIRKIDEKKNILLSLPTSAGKTIISTYTIRKYKKVCYIVPSEALAYQLTGIILASLIDIEKKGEESRNVRQETASLQYQKYVDRNDDIIISTPKELYELLSTNKINSQFDYIIIDEFHNINSDIGHYIEYVLKFAGFYRIPVICLSATIPNYTNVLNWLESIVVGEVYGVYEIKRFFNQKRFVIKKEDSIKLIPINVLENIDTNTLRSDEFTHIGLYPKDIYNLYEKLSDFPRKDESLETVVKLDDMFKLEQDIFKHLKSLSDDKLNNIIQYNLDKIQTDSLSIFELYKVMKICKNTHKTPMLIFQMNTEKCMDIYHNILTMLKEYQSIVYPNLYEDQNVIQKFYDTYTLLSEKIELGTKGNLEQAQEKIKIELFSNPAGTRAQLIECYDNFIKTKINDDILDRFNKNYGAYLTKEEIIELRTKHKTRQLNIYTDYDRLYLSNIYQPHEDCKLTDSSITYNDMRKIKHRLQSEITRNVLINGGHKKSIPKINYSHPFMIGIEFGILCYTEAVDPAIQRVTQQLINTGNPFITFSDKSLAVGVNYPIKTVMLLGGLKDEPLEDIDNTLAHQAIGRAGRRGLDAEGFIIYSGININNILVHKYKHVGRNNIELMKSILDDKNTNSDLMNYMLHEIRPKVEHDLLKIDKYVDIDKLALMQYFNMNEDTSLDINIGEENDKDVDDKNVDYEDDNIIKFQKLSNSSEANLILENIKENIRKQVERNMRKNIMFIEEEKDTVKENKINVKELHISHELPELDSWEDYVDLPNTNNVDNADNFM